MHLKLEKSHFIATKKRWAIEKQLMDPEQAEIEAECAWEQLVTISEQKRPLPRGLAALVPAIDSPGLELLTQRPPRLLTRDGE